MDFVICVSFFLSRSDDNRDLHSFPTRRSSDLECSVDVKLGAKICTTWHTYTMNKNNMIKKTRWYVMDLVDDSHMKPDRKSTRLNSSHLGISYAVFCLKKKKKRKS